LWLKSECGAVRNSGYALGEGLSLASVGARVRFNPIADLQAAIGVAVPAVSENCDVAWDFIAGHVEALVARLAVTEA